MPVTTCSFNVSDWSKIFVMLVHGEIFIVIDIIFIFASCLSSKLGEVDGLFELWVFGKRFYYESWRTSDGINFCYSKLISTIFRSPSVNVNHMTLVIHLVKRRLFQIIQILVIFSITNTSKWSGFSTVSSCEISNDLWTYWVILLSQLRNLSVWFHR
jgi:hypothetical protein